MDRRLIVAIALSGLVLLVFQLWLAPKPSEIPEGQVAAGPDSVLGETQTRTEELTRAEPDPVSTPPTGQTPMLLEAEGETTAETISIGTDLLDLDFTSQGGRLESAKLNRFTGPGVENVQIVRNGPELGLLLDTPQGAIDLDQTVFTHREEGVPGGERRLVFEVRSTTGLWVTKTYTIYPEDYLIDLAVDVRGAGDATSYRLTWDGGIPNAEPNLKHYDHAAGTIILVGKDVEKEKPGSFKKTPTKVVEGNVRWAGVRNKYFGAIMIPPEGTSTQVVAIGDNELKITGAQVVMPLLRGEGRHDFKVLLGPLDYDDLKAKGHDLERAVDLGYAFIRPLSQLMLWAMVWLYGFIPNYGVVIIILSVATKILFYPLTKTSLRSMKAMQQLQPQVQGINEKYKDDPKRKQAAIMELYKENKVNPLGGCLPLLVQMPVFFALYSVLNNSITMRQAYFVGWIDDLSTPDTIAVVAGLAIHVLPIVMFVTTVIQQRLTPMNDPRQKMMGYMMPFVMLFIFYSFPAGLNLYWTVNNVLTVAQHWWIHREAPAAAPAPSAVKT